MMKICLRQLKISCQKRKNDCRGEYDANRRKNDRNTGKNKEEEVLVIKVGSEDRPATVEDIYNIQKFL